MFEETVQFINAGIAREKDRNKRVWFELDVNVDKIITKLRQYYTRQGYMIEINPCKSCFKQKADIIISW